MDSQLVAFIPASILLTGVLLLCSDSMMCKLGLQVLLLIANVPFFAMFFVLFGEWIHGIRSISPITPDFCRVHRYLQWYMPVICMRSCLWAVT